MLNMPKTIKTIISILCAIFAVLCFFCLKEFTADYLNFKLLPSVIFITCVVGAGIFKKTKSTGLLFLLFIITNILHAKGFIAVSNYTFVKFSLILGLTVATFIFIEGFLYKKRC